MARRSQFKYSVWFYVEVGEGKLQSDFYDTRETQAEANEVARTLMRDPSVVKVTIDIERRAV